MAQIYKPGDVYFCTFPKFVQRPNTNDYNIDSLKDNASPRPVAILHEIDSNRAIAAPISSDGSQNNLLYDTFVPIKAANYPSFLKKDSFIKTNQIQVIDTKWLYPSTSPRLVGSLNTVDLDRTRYFSLYATQTEKAYTKWISEIVSKNVKSIDHGTLEAALKMELPLHSRPERRHPLDFNRMEVYKCHFQPAIHNPSPERISGTHAGILLTDGKFGHIPPGQTIAVPLVLNVEANKRVFSSLDVGISMNGQVMRACVSQIQPMNRDWIEGQALGKVDKLQMLDLDRSVINVLGLRDQVIEKSRSLIKDIGKNRSKAR